MSKSTVIDNCRSKIRITIRPRSVVDKAVQTGKFISKSSNLHLDLCGLWTVQTFANCNKKLIVLVSFTHMNVKSVKFIFFIIYTLKDCF